MWTFYHSTSMGKTQIQHTFAIRNESKPRLKEEQSDMNWWKTRRVFRFQAVSSCGRLGFAPSWIRSEGRRSLTLDFLLNPDTTRILPAQFLHFPLSDFTIFCHFVQIFEFYSLTSLLWINSNLLTKNIWQFLHISEF